MSSDLQGSSIRGVWVEGIVGYLPRNVHRLVVHTVAAVEERNWTSAVVDIRMMDRWCGYGGYAALLRIETAKEVVDEKMKGAFGMDKVLSHLPAHMAEEWERIGR